MDSFVSQSGQLMQIPAWERRSGETPQAWRAFKAYQDAGPERQKLGTYRQLYGKPRAKCPPGFFSKWAADHDWDTRVRAWDSELDRTRWLKMIDTEREMIALHIEQARAMQRFAMEALLSKDHREMTIPQIRDFLETAQKLERLAAGQDTDRTTVIGPPGSRKHILHMLVMKMEEEPSIAREIEAATDDELVEIVGHYIGPEAAALLESSVT